MNEIFSGVVGELQKSFMTFKEILTVYVFGSAARGDYSKRHSDFDLFIVVKTDKAAVSLQERINKVIIPIGLKNGVKVHTEYQGTKIRKEDVSLIKKMIEEGKVIYSSGVFVFDSIQLGLKQYILYDISLKNAPQKTLFSKILHGRKSSYYSGKKKVTKSYSGIAEGSKIILVGRGAMMVESELRKEIEDLFKKFEVDFKVNRIVYS